MPRSYKYLTPEERVHFVKHGWIIVHNAIKEEVMEEWLEDLWVRAGMDPSDKSTWFPENIAMPPHHEVRTEEFCPEAWNKM